MSHLPERNEKNCLNCGTEVHGRFCHICGQENTEPKESVLHLLNHFINDVTHFDGKFFSSLKLLITKPGFLSTEYMIGRRASYLNPVRMYLFTSAIFFVVFFSVLHTDIIKINTVPNTNDINAMDSTAFNNLVKVTNDGKPITRKALKLKLDSVKGIFSSRDISFKSKREYDSLLRTGARHDNWFMRKIFYKYVELNEKYKNKDRDKGNSATFDSATFSKDLVEKFNHTFPQLLFVLLPIFALILKLLYRRRKEYYYTDHLIFTLHIYIFLFIAMLAISGIDKIADVLHWDWLGFISLALVITIFFYFYKSLRNFYKQRRAKTIFKYFIILFGLFFAFFILYIVFLFLSLFQL